ncbi:mitochondrial 54S ribosomal protein mL58 Ecym_4038 [Eremothecium cymbalariae DBVPG|uniref:Uncharacterized protein n=1 Tax=Eremothecium cymbalariae (strain CBS 270.75 / DBVPG 7215 / KCTC 17166 / NRRL Y-17582) TaxID=931890 RepID=G8JSW7_ERECY|nr:hypothetical protein Ecym_4038 [Eremothecium cymbalariae DBVPG\
MIRFIRGFSGTSCSPAAKDLSKAIEKSGSIHHLHGTPTIYNKTSSASNYKGYMKAKIPPGTYFTPAPSSSTGSNNSETIPKSFLPKNDIRRQFVDRLRSKDASISKNAPPLQVKGEKSYHLSPQEIREIIRLRNEDPDKYTRKVLAKKFNVSPLFISIVSDAPAERKAEMDKRLASIKLKWHPGRKVAREDRKKRKELWYRA